MNIQSRFRASALTFSCLISMASNTAHSAIVYGLNEGCNFHSTKQGPFLLQVGEFRSMDNARGLSDRLRSSIQAPVSIRPHYKIQRVVIGPLESSTAVRKIACSLLESPVTHHNYKMTHAKKLAIPSVEKAILNISSDVWGDKPSHFELSGALGASWYQARNSHLQITAEERDTDVVSRATSSMLYSAGIGYRASSNALARRSYLTGLLVQLNYYYGTSSIKGDAWQYESSDVINYTFKAPIKTSRLMLELRPDLFVYKGYTPYGIFGAGAAWSKMSYSESPIGSADPLGATLLQNAMNTTVAYDLGVGLSKSVTPNITVGIEYLYTALGTLSPSVNATSAQTIVAAPSFPTQNQSVIARLSWKPTMDKDLTK